MASSSSSQETLTSINSDKLEPMSIKTAEETFPCTVCPESFISINGLKRHFRIHNRTTEKEAKLYNCELCDKALTRKDDLKRHMLVHTDERKYKCQICNAKFALKYNLTTHMLTHTGEKPFACLICSKAFTTKSIVLSHLKKQHKTDDSSQIVIHPVSSKTTAKIGKSGKLKKNGKTRPRTPLPSKSEWNRQKSRQIRAQALKIRKKNLEMMDNQALLVYPGEGNHECKICHSKFNLKTNLERHMLTHTGEKRYSCKMCSKSFTRKETLRKHMSKQHDIIEETSSHADNYPYYQPAHGERNYFCGLCNATLSSKYTLERHMLVHTDERNYKCEICNLKFKVNAHLERHMMTHTGEKPYGCLLCTKPFATRALVKMHLKRHHQTEDYSQIAIINPESNKSTRIENPKAEQEEDEEEERNSTEEMSDDDAIYECGVCDMTFKDEKTMDAHILLSHTDKPSTVSSAVVAASMNLPVKELGTATVKTGKMDTDLIFSQSSSSSTMSGERELTEAAQTEGEVYNCKICPEIFQDIQEYKKHSRIHNSGGKSYDCELCDKSFSTTSLRKQHMLVHTGERNYECEICNSKFKAKGNLAKHRLTHTGEKPYTCLLCKKSFTQKKSVIIHLETIHKTTDTSLIAIQPDHL